MNGVTGLLIALFGGTIASLIAGYFQRPKTKADATAANANATVSLSSDARQWAQLWMKKSEEAERKAEAAERKAEAAERRAEAAETKLDDLESDLTAALVHLQAQRAEINRLNGDVPPLPDSLQHYLHR